MNFQFLDPKTTIIETAPDDTLRVTVSGDRCGIRVEVMNAFPLSRSEEYIVLRDGAGKELGVIESLRELPAATADLLREQLRRRYFLPQITAIYSSAERFGSSVWDLQTDRGRCTVTTRVLQEAVHEVEPGRYLLTDVDGNRYEIKDLSALDPDSRARFLGQN